MRIYNATPLAPLGVTASDGVDSRKIILQWETVPTASSYMVYFSTSINKTKSSFNPVSYTTMEITGAAPDQTYYFWVQANNSYGSSPLSIPDSGYLKTAATSYTLSIDLTSPVTTGRGNVQSNDGAISCGSTCEASYLAGTRVILTAYPDDTSTFFMWSNIYCEEGFYAKTCTLTMNGDLSTMAAFDRKGDLDANGDVNVKDAILGLQVLSGSTPDEVNGWGNLENSSSIGLPAVLYILRMLSINQ